MRLRIAAGNWKMNMDYDEGRELAHAIIKETKPQPGTLTILGTPYIHLKDMVEMAGRNSEVKIAAQNCHQEASGAFTGEISVGMLTSIGVEYVILGHSERRQYFRESNELLSKKADAAIKGGMKPIFCCGEALEIRNEGWHERYVKNQLVKGIFHLEKDDFLKVIIAYEPIWAIGTGVTASPEQAQEMHRMIRLAIAERYDEATAEQTTILYGGSVKPGNARELFAQPDVDGGLVGGASLKAESFLPIIEALSQSRV